MGQREFTVTGAHGYNQRTTWRWIASHVLRYPFLPILFLLTGIGMAGMESLAAVLA